MIKYMVDQVLSKIKEITSIQKFGDTKILSDTYYKQQYNITLKNVVVMMTCLIIIAGEYYPQIFLEEGFHDE